MVSSPRFDFHNHTDFSNIRILDSINTLEDLVNRAIEIGLSGIAITEHECLGNGINIEILQEKVKEEHPDFKIVHGNEIYLTDTREMGQKYYHFILLALDEIGYHMMCELSSTAWLNGYYDRGLMRVPTLKSEVEDIIKRYGQGHIHASTACVGGQLGSLVLKMNAAQEVGDKQGRKQAHDEIVNFVRWCIDVFGKDNFSIEVQPSRSHDQLIVNSILPNIAKVFDLPLCVTSDAHYLTKDDQAVHEAFLNSKQGDREVAEFYSATWLQTEEEILGHIEGTPIDYEQCCKNSIAILDKVQEFKLRRPQEVPEAPVPFKERRHVESEKYPTLARLYESDSEQERFWVNECIDQLKNKNLYTDQYLSRLEEEADTMAYIGEKLDTCVFAYPLFMRHYIDLVWSCGSTLGCGRGSAGGGLSHWLLGITGTNPLVSGATWWRFLNKERVELPDIDVDLCPSRREAIFEETRKETGELGCVHVCTYGVLSTKAAIKCACFAPETKVLTDKGEKNIVDIVPGVDKVWTINRWETVEAKTYQEHTDTISIKTKNSVNPTIECTPDHEFLVLETKGKNGTRNCGRTDSALAKSLFPGLEELDSQDDVYSRYQQNIVHASPIWVKAEDIKQNGKKGSRGLHRINRSVKHIEPLRWTNNPMGKHCVGISTCVKVDEDFCELIGIFLAEGNIGTKFCNINFTIHKKEVAFRNRIIELMWKVFQLDNYTLYYRESTMAMTIVYTSYQLGSFFKRLFDCETPQDCTQWNKRVPEILREANPQLQLQLIKGFFLGDGHSSVKRTPIAKMTTVSKWLAQDLIDIYHRNFIQPSVDVELHENEEKLRCTTYNVVVYSSKAARLHQIKYIDGHIKDRLEFALEDRMQKDMPVEYNGDLYMTTNLLRKDSSVKSKDITTYCLITPSHTFTINDTIVHNCRGYRSKQHPHGIPLEEAEYLSSLIPSERGFLWELKDVIEGNPDKGRKASSQFNGELTKYPGLKEILYKIEGLIVQAGIHASGIIYPPKEDYYRYGPFMRARNGTVMTQYSLHMAEAAGATKIDWLVTEVQEVITQCIQELQEHGYIEKELTLREAYDKYVSPDSIPLDDEKTWDAIDEANILKLFQLDSMIGRQGTRLIKPRSIEELTAVNALIRLMADEGEERPMDRYVRHKEHPEQWEQEMDEYGLTENEKQILHEHLDSSYGVCYSQEQMMIALMDEKICGFTLKEGNQARKTVSKKLFDQVEALHNQIQEKATSPAMARYAWDIIVKPSLGYSFSQVHGYSYSIIGYQCAWLATHYPSVYWNTACLRVDSGVEDDASTSYEKISKAVGNIVNSGIQVSPIDINSSGYMFEPNEATQSILCGLKALVGVNGDTVAQIIENRPYSSFNDFHTRVPLNKTTMISLIKSHAFDCFAPREEIMTQYLMEQAEPKSKLTLANFQGLVDKRLIPGEYQLQARTFTFNKSLRANCKHGDYYLMEGRYYRFYEQFFDVDELEEVNGKLGISQKKWQKMYTKAMEPVKRFIADQQDNLLDFFNDSLLKEQWSKYADGSGLAWDMDSLGFYVGGHELDGLNKDRYGISRFADLPEEPVVASKRGKFTTYQLTRICGTVVAKDDAKSLFTLLTTDSGSVDVKLPREVFALFNKKVVIEQNGQKLTEEGWFTRGTLLLVNGYRQGNMFRPKKYKNTASALVYKITPKAEGDFSMTSLRLGEDPENE